MDCLSVTKNKGLQQNPKLCRDKFRPIELVIGQILKFSIFSV